MAVISSHTLNGADGTHAGGIRVRLTSLASGETLFDTEMDTGGRLSRNVDLTGTDPAARYELTFETGPYWRARGAPSAGARTVDEIVLRFCMPDPDARYHMPLIISPHSYSTWASTPE